MASKKYPLSSPSPKPSLSPSLSAVCLSTPLSGPLSARLATPPPSNRLPAIPPTQRPPSPDYFEDFEYTQEMDDDFRKIDLAAEVTLSQGIRRPPPQNPPDSPSPLSQRAWVVFRGRTPGIYYDHLLASAQTQGYGSNAYQRTFPDRLSAEVAWSAHVQDITYGKGPWVVFLGRRSGVMTKVTELECSVKGHACAVFRSCSSISDGHVKYQLFAKQVAEWFAGSDLQFNTGGLMFQPKASGVPRREVTPAIEAIAPALAPRHSPLPPTPQVAEWSGLGSKRNASESLLTPPLRKSKTARPSDGWFVAHHAVLPGMYYGVDALKHAGPVPGGFRCAPDEESANQLFLDLTINSAIVWAQKGE